MLPSVGARITMVAPLALMLGLTGCSDDNPSDPPAGAPSSLASSQQDASNGERPAAVPTEAGRGDTASGVFADVDGFAESVRIAVGADRYEADAGSVRLVFSDGSADDVTARVNCSAVTTLRESDHHIVLSYPDGDVNCADLLSPDGESVDTAPASGVARVTVGDQSWELTNVVCGFGAEGTGIEGAEINLAAGADGISLYLAIDPDVRYIEVSDLVGGREFSTLGADEPTIVVDGNAVSASGRFIALNDTGTPEAPVTGSVDAICP